MYIFLTIQKGKKQYFATVSSFDYQDKNLWLYVWQDDKKGVKGNCGYIPNGKVIAAGYSTCTNPHMPQDTAKIVKIWAKSL